MNALLQLSLQHQELQALQAERDQLQDHAAGITRDEIVDQARGQRNDAIHKYICHCYTQYLYL